MTREGGGDGLGEAFQPINNGDQDVLDAPVLQLVHHPEHRLLNPDVASLDPALPSTST